MLGGRYVELKDFRNVNFYSNAFEIGLPSTSILALGPLGYRARMIKFLFPEQVFKQKLTFDNDVKFLFP